MLDQVANGLSVGAVYALIAVGYALVFGVLNVVNLAHGHVLMVAAFAGIGASSLWGVGLIPLLMIGFLAGAALGFLIERTTIRPLPETGHERETAALITTIAAAVLVEQTMAKYVGLGARRFPSPIEETFISLGGLRISNITLLILTITVVITVLLWFVIMKLRVGRAIRSIAEDPEVAQLMGVNTTALSSATFTVASGLAGVAGVLVGIYVGAINVAIGHPMGLKGLVILVVGGSGSVAGAALIGLGLGVIESMSVEYISSSYRDAVAYFVLVLVLMVRPQGLFGQAQVSR